MLNVVRERTPARNLKTMLHARSIGWFGSTALLALLYAAPGCGSSDDAAPSSPPQQDAGRDAAQDRGSDAVPDGANDAGSDTGSDTAPDAPADGGSDAAPDAGPTAFVIGQPNASSNEGVRLGL